MKYEVTITVDADRPPTTANFPTTLVVHAFKVVECYEPLVIFELPLRLVSLANEHTHWRTRQKRAKEHRSIVGLRTGSALAWAGVHGTVVRRVRLTRLAPRRLDSDNAVIAAKECRDGVARALGVDDHDERVTWEVAQEKTSGYGLRVELWR
jgi:hypothetical protein